MKKILLAILMTLTVVSMVFAGGSSESADSGKINLTVIHSYTREEAATDNTRKGPRETVLEYADANSDRVTLEITEFQHNDYETRAQALAAANDLPDVFLVKGSWIQNFVDSGLVADITDAVNSCEWKDMYRPGLFDPIEIDGRYYGAPMQFSTTSIVFYNKELWKEIGYDEFPSTWEEVFAAVPLFREKGIDTIEFGNSDKWQFNSSWISTIGPRVAGEEWVSDIIAMNGEAAFTDPEFIKVLDLVREIGASGALNIDYPVIGNQQASSLFLQGKAATTIDGYWNVEYMATATTPDVLDNVGFAYMPSIEGGAGDPTSIASGCGWFVCVNSQLEGEELEEATKLALYMSGPSLSQRMTDFGLISTCTTEPSEGVEFDNLHLSYHDFVNSATSSVPIWDANINASVIATMNDQFVELLAGRTTSEAAAKAIQAEYELIQR